MCEKRTNEKFRQKMYGSHHKVDSPLLRLNIDMVEQFPVGDSLHLLHLGNMKRLLHGWRDGIFRNSQTKWPARTTNEVSMYLTNCKMPSEFHRAVRGLDCLAFWKGTEYRTLLHYIGIVALKDHLEKEAYEHFLLFFCAITICSSKQLFGLLPLARTLLEQYIEIFKEIYGEAYLTSNVHNLIHLVDEVECFGELQSFSAYPFENMLGKIKRLLRKGHLPLSQVAKRIGEGINCNTHEIDYSQNSDESFLKVVFTKPNDGQNVPDNLKSPSNPDAPLFFSKVEFDEYCVSTDSADCWLLSKQSEIACVTNIIFRHDNSVKLCCFSTQQKENFFTIPIESKFLDIYCTNRDAHVKSEMKLINLSDIKCKLVRLQYREKNVFVPLLHTNK